MTSEPKPPVSTAVEPLRDAARQAVEAARAAGADEAESCLDHVRSVSARAEQDDLSGAEASDGVSLGLRVLVRGAVGIASTNRVDGSALEELARRAVALARCSPSEEGLRLPVPAPVRPVDGLWSDDTAARPLQDAVTGCASVLQALRGVDRRIRVDMAAVSFHAATRWLATSGGILLTERNTGASAAAVGLAADGDDVTGMDSEDDEQIHAARLDAAHVGRTLGERLLRQLDARAWDGPSNPRVVLGPEVFQELLLDPLLASMQGESVRLGTSALKDRLGKAVAVPHLWLRDDPLEAGAVGAEAFDREGVPHVVTTLLDAGVLTGWLHNAVSAFRARAALTGHAVGGATGLPGVGAARLCVVPGAASLEDLLRDVGDGVYVARFSGAVDEVSGDFSGVAKCSFRIRGGRLAEPLRETTVAGNAWEALLALGAVGRDLKSLGGNRIPHVVAEGLHVAGG